MFLGHHVVAIACLLNSVFFAPLNRQIQWNLSVCMCRGQPRDGHSWVDHDRERTFSAQKKVRWRSLARSTLMLSPIHLFCIGMVTDTGVRKSAVQMPFIIPGSRMEDLINWPVELMLRSCLRGFALCKLITFSTSIRGDNSLDDYSLGLISDYWDTYNWERGIQWSVDHTEELNCWNMLWK